MYRRDDTNMDVLYLKQALSFLLVCTPRHHLPKPRPFSGTLLHSNSLFPSILLTVPERHFFSSTARNLFHTYFSKTTFAKNSQEMKVFYWIFLKSRNCCSWCCKSSSFLELSICVRCFCWWKIFILILGGEVNVIEWAWNFAGHWLGLWEVLIVFLCWKTSSWLGV